MFSVRPIVKDAAASQNKTEFGQLHQRRYASMQARKEISEQPMIISVDAYDDKIVDGRFWDGREGSETKFRGMMQLFLLIEKLLSGTKRPTEEKCKSFSRPDPAAAGDLPRPADPTRGTLATFRLRVLFRQNISWQGLLTWVEARQEESFRSALEFSVLLDSALTCAGETKPQ